MKKKAYSRYGQTECIDIGMYMPHSAVIFVCSSYVNKCMIFIKYSIKAYFSRKHCSTASFVNSTPRNKMGPFFGVSLCEFACRSTFGTAAPFNRYGFLSAFLMPVLLYVVTVRAEYKEQLKVPIWYKRCLPIQLGRTHIVLTVY